MLYKIERHSNRFYTQPSELRRLHRVLEKELWGNHQQKWYERNKKRKAQLAHAWYEKNRTAILEKTKEYYAKRKSAKEVLPPA